MGVSAGRKEKRGKGFELLLAWVTEGEEEERRREEEEKRGRECSVDRGVQNPQSPPCPAALAPQRTRFSGFLRVRVLI
jgi:hypothetical protein